MNLNQKALPLKLLGLTLSLISVQANAQTENNLSSETPKLTENASQTSSSTQTVRRRRPIQNKENFARSRFTSDRSESEADHRDLLLATGIDKIVDLDPEFKISDRPGAIMTSNTAVLMVVPASIGEQKQLIFKPVGPGGANVTVRDKSGTVKIIFDVRVANQDLVRYLGRLKENLSEVEGIRIGIEDQKVVIRGDVLTPNDYGAIINEIGDKSYGDAVVNKATMSNVTLNALAKRIESDLQSISQTIVTEVLNGKIILKGSVDSDAAKTRALRRAEWYLPTIKISDPIASAPNAEKNDKPLQIIQSDIQVTPPQPKRESKLVRLSVYFVELNKDFLKNFGFKWQPGFTADPSISIGSTATGSTGTSTGGGFTFSGTLSSLFPTLSSAPSSASYGRILKTETVVTKSGEASRVRDQQQIPTQTVGQNGATGTGTPITVGFDVSITPTILQAQDVNVDISLDQVNQVGKGIGNVPIINTHHVDTKLYMKSGETAAVAGVNTQDVTTSFNRDDPNATTATGAIKPLFTLQRSKNMGKARGEFVVFVNPQIIESASEGTEDLKKNFRMPSGSR